MTPQELDIINTDLESELNWFSRVLQFRLADYFEQQNISALPDDVLNSPPDLGQSEYSLLIQRHQLSAIERLILVLCLTVHLRPQLLDVFLVKNSETNRGFSEFGGHLGQHHGGFLPTVETALFICCGSELIQRFHVESTLKESAKLRQLGLISIIDAPQHEPWHGSALLMPQHIVEQLTTGEALQPQYGIDFPAKRIDTSLEWSHLVLPHSVMEQLNEIRSWMLYGDQLLNTLAMKDKLSPGFTALFSGPSGTGKTLAANLLGKYCQRDVYKIDLSLVVSKYIGETEKNLAKIFDRAETQNWLLFIDEADSLFSKRGKVDDAKDHYANQGVSFLLQRIETHPGIVILASNLKSNIDDAFKRRFQSIIEFPLPQAQDRYRIWQHALPQDITLNDDIDLKKIADKYDLSGGTILNVVRFACLRMLARQQHSINRDDIEEGIRREYRKEGKRL